MSDATPAPEQDTSGAADTVPAAKLAEALEANRQMSARLAALEEAATKAAADKAKAVRDAEAAERAKAKASGDLLKVTEGLERDLLAAREELAALRVEADGLKAEKAARIEALTASNSERVAKLPEQFRDLVPDGLDADATARHIERVEAIALKAAERPAGGRGGFKPAHQTGQYKWPEAFLREAQRLSPGMKPETFARTKAGKRFATEHNITLPPAA